jgi:alpha-tubulin suppressor-like RCC1 family protein
LFSFGSNQQGQLGLGGSSNQFKPVQVNFSYGRIAQVASGRHHSLVLTCLGKVYGCGRGSYGELGLPLTDLAEDPNIIAQYNFENGIKEFVEIYSLSKTRVQSIYAGGFHTFV